MVKWFPLLLNLPFIAFCQDPASSLNTYYSLFHEEKIYVHTDKEYYFPEETLYGKIYHSHSQDHRLIDSSVIVNVELWDSNKTLIRQLQTKTIKGMSSFSFTIDYDLDPGIFTEKFIGNFEHPGSFPEQVDSMLQ